MHKGQCRVRVVYMYAFYPCSFCLAMFVGLGLSSFSLLALLRPQTSVPRPKSSVSTSSSTWRATQLKSNLSAPFLPPLFNFFLVSLSSFLCRSFFSFGEFAYLSEIRRRKVRRFGMLADRGRGSEQGFSFSVLWMGEGWRNGGWNMQDMWWFLDFCCLVY